MRRFTLALLATLLLTSVSHAQLLTNGSFELPVSNGDNQIIAGGDSTSITGWTTLLSGVERFGPPTFALGAAADGTIVIDICPSTFTGGGITQTFATTPGMEYVLNFQAGTANSFGRTGDYISTVSVGNMIQQFSGVNLSSTIVWETFTVPFTAQDAATTVTFTNGQNANTHFSFIDAASVTVVPEPGTAGLLALPAMFVWLRRRKAIRP